nr:MAG TPA: hypothetical protein [Caudoviricetes sp.]
MNVSLEVLKFFVISFLGSVIIYFVLTNTFTSHYII